MKKYHVYHSEEELEFDLDNDNYRYNTLNIYIGEHSFSIEMTADCRRLTTAVKRFSEGYKAAVADGVFPAAIAEFLKSYHIGTLVEDAREMGEPLEYNFYGISELNDGTFVNAFELENEVEDSFYIRLTAPYEINGIEKNFPTVYVDCFTASEEPEIVTVDDDGSNDEPDEDEEIKATPVSEDAEDEDDDLPDEYWIVKEEMKMKNAQITITAANSAAAKKMVTEIVKATGVNFSLDKPFGIMVGASKDRVDSYSDTADAHFGYTEVYENGEIVRAHFFKNYNKLVATIQVDANGAEKLTDTEIAEICKALGIETPATTEKATTVITDAELTTTELTTKAAGTAEYTVSMTLSYLGGCAGGSRDNVADVRYYEDKTYKTFKGAVESIIKARIAQYLGNRYGQRHCVESVTLKDASGEILISYRKNIVSNGNQYGYDIEETLEIAESVEAEVEAVADKWAERNAETVKAYEAKTARNAAVAHRSFKAHFERWLYEKAKAEKAAIYAAIAAAVIENDDEEDDELDDEEYELYEPETPEPTPPIDSDATIATLGSLLVTALTALYNATTAPAKIVEEPAAESTCYVVRLHGYNAEFPSDPLYSKGDAKFDSLGDAVKYALDDRKARGANEHFGGSIIDKDFDDGNVAGVATVMTILPTGEIETTADEVKRILEKPAGTDEETGAVIQPTSDEAAAKDLSDTVLDLKISADEIEELLADGYTLGDSGRASIAKAQALMEQALAELAKLKSTDAAA